MKSILELSDVKAYRYFMESSNYCSLDLPKYIDFSKVLTYVEEKVGKKSLDEILKDKGKKPSDYEGVNHRVLIKKDAKFMYRPIDIANPYLYYLLVRHITTKGNWKEIKRVFSTFVSPNIDVISIPKVKSDKEKSHKAAGITDWWENIEQKTFILSLKYRYMFVTDITNCYGSIYTHTIAWALMGKELAKKKKGKSSFLGNIIDTYMQGMQYGQTNGIPQGSVLFDFIAEIILGYADYKLSKILADKGITDYKILRYRDDYRIFCNKKDELEEIAFILQDVLANLNFQLNAKKTMLTEYVIDNALKPDKLAYIKRIPLYRNVGKRIYTTVSTLQQELIYIYQFAKEFPNSGTLRKLLTTFSKRLHKRKKKINDPEILIAILTEIALGSPNCYSIVIQLCSVLINKLSSTSKREEVVNSIYEKFQMIPNIGELEIWMQRITYQWNSPINYTEAICKIVANVPDVVLWNNEWVADEYKDAFPQYEICTNWLRDCYTPIIDIDEVSLFDAYYGMNIEHKMPEAYLKHKVFDDLKYMKEFYGSISMSCCSFVAMGIHGIINYASYVYLAIEGTLDSITILLENGRINDAYALIRKLFDDILLEIYMDVILKEKFNIDNFFVQEVNEWIQGKRRIPKTDKILKCLKESQKTKDLYPLFGWDTYLKKNRELLDDSVHSNRFNLMLLNCNTIYIKDRERHLKNCEVMLNQLFLIHLSFIFHLNSHYLMASDYMDHMDLGLTPPEGSENWIASFAQDAFDKIIRPHRAIADFIISTCTLEIS